MSVTTFQKYLATKPLMVAAALVFIGTSAMTPLRAQEIVTQPGFEADQIEQQDGAKRMVLSGNAVFNQQNWRLGASEIVVYFGDLDTRSIKRVYAHDQVNLLIDDIPISGDALDYDYEKQVFMLAGNARFPLGDGTIEGELLVIDMNEESVTLDGKTLTVLW